MVSHPFLPSRYETMNYRFCGRSGLKLPLISLGLWQNFGDVRPFGLQKEIAFRAFDLGVTHFDLANNYGPPVGEAERTFRKLLDEGLRLHRDELILSTKAGYNARPGPYGEGGSRKNLIASCDESLRRTGLDYFDIFYHHRMDVEVPLEETMEALSQLVRQGKALYIGVSSHSTEHFSAALGVIRDTGLTRLTSVMSRYNLTLREDETGKWPVALEHGVGGVAFSPLAEGFLTSKYLGKTIPESARHAADFNDPAAGAELLRKVGMAQALNQLAAARGQTLAQMAIAWVLRQPPVSSALIGASSVAQLEENAAAIRNLSFSGEELARIDEITTDRL